MATADIAIGHKTEGSRHANHSTIKVISRKRNGSRSSLSKESRSRSNRKSTNKSRGNDSSSDKREQTTIHNMGGLLIAEGEIFADMSVGEILETRLL